MRWIFVLSFISLVVGQGTSGNNPLFKAQSVALSGDPDTLPVNDQSQYFATLLVAEKWSFDKADPDANRSFHSAAGEENSKTFWLLQVRGPISDSWKKLINQYLATKNTKLGQYFPHNTFLVQGIDGLGFRQFLRKGPGVLGVVRFKDYFKISQTVTDKLNNSTFQDTFSSITLRIRLFNVLDSSVSANDTTSASVVVDLRNFLTTFTPAQQADVSITTVSSIGFDITIARFPVFKKILSWLSAHDEVLWIEESLPIQLTNYYSKRVTQGDNLNQLPLYAHGLNGVGITIGLGDTGIDYDHCFFRDPNLAVTPGTYNPSHRKLVYYYNYVGADLGDNQGHGTHTSGTAAGQVFTGGDTTTALYNGIAPNAKLAFFQMGDAAGSLHFPDDLGDYFGELHVNGHADIMSNSWGQIVWGYNTLAWDTDKYAWDNPNFLILYAAGNAGVEDPGFSGWGSIYQPANSKNIVTVGASMTLKAAFGPATISPIYLNYTRSQPPATAADNEWLVAEFSSRGPTSDGRIKPDIVAPGYLVISAKGDSNLESNQCADAYMGDEGTSMATPGTAGTSALIMQYFKSGFYPTGAATAANAMVPSSALVKAVLVASGQSLTGGLYDGITLGSPPDFIQGFGRIQVDTVLKFTTAPNKNPGFFVVQNKPISTGQKHGYCFFAKPWNTPNTPGSTRLLPPFKATLVWTDPPAAFPASIQLINNLDLGIVETATNRLWMGNNRPNQQWDVLNTVEQVVLTNDIINVSSGIYYAVFVTGANIPQGPQNYALVVNGNFVQASMNKCAGTAAVCPSNCSAATNWGTCNAATGACTCAVTRAGPGCKQKNTQLTPVKTSPLTYSGSIPSLKVNGYVYYNILLTAAQIQPLTQGLWLSVTTPQSIISPAGLSVFVSLNVVPSAGKFQRAFFTHDDDAADEIAASKWLWLVPKAFLGSGGRVNFAFYGFCCSPRTYTATWVAK